MNDGLSGCTCLFCFVFLFVVLSCIGLGPEFGRNVTETRNRLVQVQTALVSTQMLPQRGHHITVVRPRPETNFLQNLCPAGHLFCGITSRIPSRRKNTRHLKGNELS